MSVTYKLVGKRNLRRYTSSKETPVYSAETEVSVLAQSLCNVPWSASPQKDATTTYHTDEIVYYTDPAKKEGITGLDYNVVVRDKFDAALFCGGHVNGMHRVYGNAACYKFELPTMGTYPRLEHLKVNVTSDPYNSTGARIAVFTNSTGVIPTECASCRQGSAPSASHSCTKAEGSNAWTTNDTYADAVAPREERSVTYGSTTTTTWHAVNGTCDFAFATPLQLQKYLFVFVLLENYSVSRDNWVEGCSFIDNLVEVTTSSAVTGWTAGSQVDTTDAAGGFKVFGTSSAVVLDGSVNAAVGCEASRSGYKLPDRVRYPGFQVATSGLVDLHAKTATPVSEQGYDGSYPNSVSVSPRCYFTEYWPWNPQGTVGSMPWTFYNIVAAFGKGSTGTLQSFVPGVKFWLLHARGGEVTLDYPNFHYALLNWSDRNTPVVKSRGTNSDGYLAMDRQTVTFTAVSGAASVASYPAYSMLLNNKNPYLYLAGAFDVMKSGKTSSTAEADIKYTAITVLVGDERNTYVLGYLLHDRYRTEPLLYYAMPCADDLYAEDTEWKFVPADATTAATPVTTTGRLFGDFRYVHSKNAAVVSVDDIANGVLTLPAAFGSPICGRYCTGQWSTSGYVINTDANDSVVVTGSSVNVVPLLTDPGIIGSTIPTETTPRTSLSVLVSGQLSKVGTTSVSSVAKIVFDYGASPTHTVTAYSISPNNTAGFYASPYYNLGTLAGFLLFGTFTRIGSTSVNGVALYNVDTSSVSKYSASLGKTVTGTGVCSDDRSMVSLEPRAIVDTYTTSPDDSQVTVATAASSVLGLRNCLGNLKEGSVVSASLPKSRVGVSFTVRATTRTLNLTDTNGVIWTATSIPLWRVSATSLLVPFIFPKDFTVSKLRLSWTQPTVVSNIDAATASASVVHATSGARVNVWFRPGERLTSMPSIVDRSFYDASVSSIGEWILIGTVDVTSSSSTDFEYQFGSGDGTFLFTGWIPTDSLDVSSSTPGCIGIGRTNVDCDMQSCTGYEYGWFPTSVSLLS